MRNRNIGLVVSLFVAAVMSCDACSKPKPDGYEAAHAPAQSAGAKLEPCRTVLNVLLFPYVPDCSPDEHFASMKVRCETEFRRRSGYCANVTIADPNGMLYDSKALAAALTADKPAFDVVEIDSVILGELAESQSIKPWDAPNPDDWWPAARAAVTVGTQIWGIPHLMCGEFVIARDAAVLQATTSSALAEALRKLGTPATNLVGNAKGSWTLPGLYLDAWNDTYPDGDPNDAIDTPLDPGVVGSLKTFLQECATDADNGCLAGSYEADAKEVEAFVTGTADAIFGYSERLHVLLQRVEDKEAIGIAPAPIGDGAHLLSYTDALVRRSGCDAECAAAATEFVAYLNAPETMKWYLRAEECSVKVPARYLLPATRSAFEVPEIGNDRLYAALRTAVEAAKPMPNQGLESRRRAMRDALVKELLPSG